jgi:arsenate reductase
MSKPLPPSTRESAAVFHALAQETRLETYRLLLRYQPFGLAAGDISRLLSVPHNTLSTHLQELEAADLIHSRREGRSVIFAAVPARLDDIITNLATVNQPARQRRAPVPARTSWPQKRPTSGTTGRTYKVLVLCSGNAARSLMAEAMIRREGAGRFDVYSAGSAPRKQANPHALALLRRLGYDTAGLAPKPWTTFADPDAPEMDFIITLCDRAAGEACPDWPGHPLAAHWGVPPVAELKASRGETEAAVKETYRRLMYRVTAFVNLSVEDLSLDELQARLKSIGRLEGASELAMSEA